MTELGESALPIESKALCKRWPWPVIAYIELPFHFQWLNGMRREQGKVSVYIWGGHKHEPVALSCMGKNTFHFKMHLTWEKCGSCKWWPSIESNSSLAVTGFYTSESQTSMGQMQVKKFEFLIVLFIRVSDSKYGNHCICIAGKHLAFPGEASNGSLDVYFGTSFCIYNSLFGEISGRLYEQKYGPPTVFCKIWPCCEQKHAGSVPKYTKH